MSNQEISIRFFLQLAIVLAAVRLVGAGARRIGQPQVVGEMIAGVLLGPSLLGWLAPGFAGWLAPSATKAVLFATSQIGLVLYMFVVGMEFDVDLVASVCAGQYRFQPQGSCCPSFWAERSP
jgi:Kef-type K+ transport system membrane component KefB